MISIGGCGGSSDGEGCDFNLNSILNGPNFDNATSEWECNGPAFEFAFYQDGTGRNSGAFIRYQRTGCRTISFQFETNPSIGGVFDNLDGSVSEGVLTFDEFFQDTVIFQDCILRIFEDDDEFF